MKVRIALVVGILSLSLLSASCSGGGGGGGGSETSNDDGALNHQPISDAGPDQAVTAPTLVLLSGGGSSDSDGDDLTCLWTFLERPVGSSASLSDPTEMSPTFTADVPGTYRLQLTVDDGTVSSTPDTVTITAGAVSTEVIADHRYTDILQVPVVWIEAAKADLHVAYGHTSHGSQIITGMNGLDAFMGGTGLYAWNDGPQAGALDLDDYFTSGDLGNPDRTTWAARTRTYLDNPANSDVNVVMWSWCGQASTSIANIDIYLGLMEGLIADYPGVDFVFMTGHLDGGGLSGLLHLANEHIRAHCRANGRILFDFADIETYDPDGTWFGDKTPNDNCDYDSDANGSLDGNWAIEWQNTHTVDVDWYDCGGAHTQSLNSNRKAYAVWWMFARIAGWDGQ